MTLSYIRTAALAAALIGGSVGIALAQAGSTSGATGAGSPSATTTGPSTNTAPAMNQTGTSSSAATSAPSAKSASDGKMGDCPAGMARTAAPDNTKGPCQKI